MRIPWPIMVSQPMESDRLLIVYRTPLRAIALSDRVWIPTFDPRFLEELDPARSYSVASCNDTADDRFDDRRS